MRAASRRHAYYATLLDQAVNKAPADEAASAKNQDILVRHEHWDGG